MRFYRRKAQVYCPASGEKNNEFIWLVDDNSFSLGNGYYLLDTSGDITGMYWKSRFIKWFKQNVNFVA
jgi:hypothetical protein